jgi:hypothetical protein
MGTVCAPGVSYVAQHINITGIHQRFMWSIQSFYVAKRSVATELLQVALLSQSKQSIDI